MLTVFLVLDKRGKEAYFLEDEADRSFADAMTKKRANPQWTMRTDDWGYFYTAFRAGQGSYWKDYDVFLCVALTAGLAGSLWVASSILDLWKLAQRGWVKLQPTVRVEEYCGGCRAQT